MSIRYIHIVKLRDYHEYNELVELAKLQSIELPELPFATKDELVTYMLNNGFKLEG